MIIDSDCHLSSQKYDSLSLTAPDLIHWMDRAGIDKALIWLRPTYLKEIEAENKAIFEAVNAYPKRLIGFGWVNPRLGKPRTFDMIKRCYNEYGFSGIKFNGAQDDYVIDDPELVMPFVEKAADYHKPIAFHIGADFYENTHPYRLGHIAEAFPDTQFLMVHMGGAGLPSLSLSAIQVALKYKNITLIGSGINERAILSAIQKLGSDRVCFGSDSPFGLMHVQLAMYQALLRDFLPQDKDKIFSKNISRVLGVSP
jgi:uncharacterized protein